MMKIGILLAIFGLFIVNLPVAAQIKTTPLGSFPCENNCMLRVDELGQVYALKDDSTLIVQRTPHNQEFSIPRRGTMRDFIPFSDGRILLFDNEALSGELALYNLTTQELTIVYTGSGFTPCHYQAIYGFSIRYAFRRIGLDHILLCSHTDIVLAQLTQNELVIEDSLQIGVDIYTSPWSHIGTSQDNKLYIVATATKPLAEKIVPNIEQIDFASQILVLIYDLALQTWNYRILNLPDEVLSAGWLISQFIGVDARGRMYFSDQWSEGDQDHFLLYSYDQEGNVDWSVSEDDFDGTIFHTFVLGPDTSIIMASGSAYTLQKFTPLYPSLR